MKILYYVYYHCDVDWFFGGDRNSDAAISLYWDETDNTLRGNNETSDNKEKREIEQNMLRRLHKR